jgi:signal transduction histidine kinase
MATLPALALYAYAPFLWRPSSLPLKTFSDSVQLLIGILLTWVCATNAQKSQDRVRAFWALNAVGAAIWTISTGMWAWYEVVLKTEVPYIFPGDILFFFQTAPWLLSMAVRPHTAPNKTRPGIGVLDATILFTWWIFVYFFFISPWHYVIVNEGIYGNLLNIILFGSDVALAGWALAHAIRTRGDWRLLYANYAAATALRVTSSYFLNTAYDAGHYYSGSFYDVPQLIAYAWLIVMAAEFGARHLRPEPTPTEEHGHGVWPARAAMAAVMSMPVLGLWAGFVSDSPINIRMFRLGVTLTGVLVLGLLMFVKQTRLDRELLRLLQMTEESLEERSRLQEHVMRTEKLASLGQLVAGAAHEMNNPLTSIMGYSELLADDPSMGRPAQDMGAKISQQARRVRRLVQSLLTFAKQSPMEKAPVNLDSVISQTLQLRQADLTSHKIVVMHQQKEGMPAVLGDANQLMQAMFHILNNAIDAMDETGGGTLSIETRQKNGSVTVEIADSGSGLKDPNRIFDPFYTTKPIGKGTGLGLSATYGIVVEHGGAITAHNRPQGGAVFVITLPALKDVIADAGDDSGKMSATPGD